MPAIDESTRKRIEALVEYYNDSIDNFNSLAKALSDNLSDSKTIKPLMHSIKYRVKEPEHLAEKLMRIAEDMKAEGLLFDIDNDNLFTRVGDLAGVRLLHLHTTQIEKIHQGIREVVQEHKYKLIGKPTAYTWDIETQEYYKRIGMKVVPRQSLYTSVHYDLQANRKTKMQCELQVRTLVEEVWSEVSHQINYPRETDNASCKEQLKVLARIASGCTRLVDSIFSSHNDGKSKKP